MHTLILASEIAIFSNSRPTSERKNWPFNFSMSDRSNNRGGKRGKPTERGRGRPTKRPRQGNPQDVMSPSSPLTFQIGGNKKRKTNKTDTPRSVKADSLDPKFVAPANPEDDPVAAAAEKQKMKQLKRRKERQDKKVEGSAYYLTHCSKRYLVAGKTFNMIA